MSQNVSEQIIEFLTGLGVKHIYGIPGDTIDSMMEALRKQNKIKFIVLRHEEVGAFAASAHGKLTGEIGVCMACQGPGAVHLLNGLYDAALDGAPVLAITGQVLSQYIGSGMPQEINQISLFADACVYNQELRVAEQVIPTLISACQAALAKRGVAHISIPSDVIRLPAIPHKVNYDLFTMQHSIQVSEHALQKAAEILNASKKVTILFGDGARECSENLIELSQKLQAPLVHTSRARDIVDNKTPALMGGIGLMGSYAGNHAIQHCDALLVVGSSFGFAEYYPEKAQIIQIDREPNKISKHSAVRCALVGEANDTLSRLFKITQTKSNNDFLQAAIKNKSLNSKLEKWEARPTKKGEPIHPQALTEKINEYLTEDAIICGDVGEVTVWTNNFLKLNGKQRFIWSANLASLGSCLPATLAAKLCYPNRQVVGLAGDGGFTMLLGDFATAVKYNLPIIYVIYNNFAYGFIELEEQGEGNPIFGTKLHNPNYAEVARAFGGDGITVKDYDELDAALTKACASEVPFVVDVHTNPNERIIPPVITAKMMGSYMMSQIKSWFAKPSEAE